MIDRSRLLANRAAAAPPGFHPGVSPLVIWQERSSSSVGSPSPSVMLVVTVPRQCAFSVFFFFFFCVRVTKVKRGFICQDIRSDGLLLKCRGRWVRHGVDYSCTHWIAGTRGLGNSPANNSRHTRHLCIQQNPPRFNTQTASDLLNHTTRT